MSPMLTDLQVAIQRLRDNKPLWFATADPNSILLLAVYHTGSQHATYEIATGNPSPDWLLNDISADASTLLAYIRVEQLKLLHHQMGGDAFKSTMESRMIRRMGGDALHEDPELFDEATGPTPCHPAD